MTLRSLKRRVALLMDAVEDDYQVGILRGVSQAAEPTNLQLVCVAGGVVGDPTLDPRSQRNFLFDLLEPQQFEGVLALSGALGNQLGAAKFAQFLKRFSGRPIVNLGIEVPALHSISVDGAAGMRGVVSHLIQVHNHRRIAFIRGPVTSLEAEQRYAAYCAALADNGLALDPRLVLQGTWLRESGALAVRELLDERSVRVESINALAAANDYMALGALDALADRGISVPAEIAVTGFDDLDITRCAVPPLTTVRQPTGALGRDGLRRLVSLMNGAEEPLHSELVAQIVERRSCGCAKVEARLAARRASLQGRSFEAAIVERRTLICAELARVAHGALFGVGRGWEQRLLAALLNDLTGQGSSDFLPACDQIMVKLQRAGGELSVCQAVLATLRREVNECAADDGTVLALADDLFEAARALVSEFLVRVEISRKLQALLQVREFSQLSALLLGQTDLATLRNTFEERFRALGIPALALGLFTEPGVVTPTCLCLAAYGSARQKRVPETFRASDLGPPDLFTQERGALLVQPLLFEGAPMGIVTVALGALDITIFEQLREILGTGLRGFRLAALERAPR
ncbi:MAG TPA: substrate-binding domain-containing protein [Polyangiaceae bacterium]|jgi:sigma-B regulation protein RsbU (phosphoserine phosphatase)|nr:substrate-binding domain-containing protein [Polyangiaceae bacterium]